ncbi:Fe2+-enterobactin ABC transporter substrate-binding protein [Cellulomonas oligotrophica]|uniref:Iron complex transport system substrate-binding protein n=1 Tax=Cellulomonas oligotrophica TaxID=931536 RepID=A0A7Y9FFH2_9CELL|nr:Fe2+-enterobactin ABC transporter substrate-binding protein [Cellulomonas oligotrophica]NYD86366.1 iron complex transport system substrate-binding protein [Cellulomonas oligotrophica]GIG32743.1 iron-enterobactin transporter periplasmic-binding protein [Cellulomonas oligotrophica]
MQRSHLQLGALAALAALTLTACTTGATPDPAGTDAAPASDGTWPRTITHELGETVIEAEPLRIVSTSVTLTGILLSIDAPIVASAASTPAETNQNTGFFDWWADVAVERGVEVLYQNIEYDEEAVIAAEPDLILVSTTGADATADQYDALSAIAPTVAVDYSAATWQDVALDLGEATGLEEQAEATVEEFDARVAEVAGAITVPEGSTNAVVFYGDGTDTAFAKPEGSHGTLLASLGFDVVGADDALDTAEQARTDFAFVSLENTVQALTAETVFLVNGSTAEKEALLSEPVLANAPAVVSEQVYPLGPNSFRIDYYSATEIVNTVEELFS